MGHKVENEIVLDGHPDIITARRTAIKLAQRPKIVVAIPIGGKAVMDVFEAPDGKRYANQRGFRAQGLLPVQFLLTHMNWTPPLNVSIAYTVKMNMLSSHARQVMTMEAIRMGAEYIFYVDDDTLIPPLGLYTLYNFMEQNPQAGAVTGVYTTRETPNEPLIYKEHGEGCAWDFEMGPGAKPELVFGAGAGCLLARVSAIKAWMDANPGVPIWADEKDISSESASNSIMWGHDVRFCRLLNLSGAPVYVHGQVLCGHYDIQTGTTFEVPDTAPGFAKTRERLKNINTGGYWNSTYATEGTNLRWHPEVCRAVTDAVPRHAHVVELGCGPGVLGALLAAQKGVLWRGYDISRMAVETCCQHFLDAQVLDVRDLTVQHIGDADTVVMAEVLEHLEYDAGVKLLATIRQSLAHRIICTGPDNTMPPSEEPEHVMLFSEEVLRDMLLKAGFDDTWRVHVAKCDALRIIAVIERI